MPNDFDVRIELGCNCDSLPFKADIKDLCENCRIPTFIHDKFMDQIIFQALHQKESLTDKQFLKYIEDEIENARKAMRETNFDENRFKRDAEYRPNRQFVFIWNKERIKALNAFVKSNTKSKTLLANSDIKKPDNILYIWNDTEASFWHIVKTYANEYIEEVDGKITWKKRRPGIQYLAGFTKECIEKGWINKLSFDATQFKAVYMYVFSLHNFDPKPFQSAKLDEIDPEYRKPFKALPHKRIYKPQNPSNP